jgi:hypothetical protein
MRGVGHLSQGSRLTPLRQSTATTTMASTEIKGVGRSGWGPPKRGRSKCAVTAPGRYFLRRDSGRRRAQPQREVEIRLGLFHRAQRVVDRARRGGRGRAGEARRGSCLQIFGGIWESRLYSSFFTLAGVITDVVRIAMKSQRDGGSRHQLFRSPMYIQRKGPFVRPGRWGCRSPHETTQWVCKTALHAMPRFKASTGFGGVTLSLVRCRVKSQLHVCVIMLWPWEGSK